MQIHTETKTWKHTSANFTVEVVWWKRLSEKLLKDSLPFELRFSLPENHWNVYAYIYPKHQLFNKIENDSLFDYGIDLPLHCGSSYHSWIFN